MKTQWHEISGQFGIIEINQFPEWPKEVLLTVIDKTTEGANFAFTDAAQLRDFIATLTKLCDEVFPDV